MGELKDLRVEKRLTQQQAAEWVGISLRSYKSYENEEKKVTFPGMHYTVCEIVSYMIMEMWI